MSELRALRADDFDSVHAAFLEAFSDYVVPFALTREQLTEMLARRAYRPAASVGVFDEGRLVAFTLNGVDGQTAYDTGTGVVPSHRRRGLGGAMLDFLLPRLREQGCTRYQLEVIASHTAAVELYRSHGFEETRGLQCWSFTDTGEGETASDQEGTIHDEWCDVAPSWQNTTASIHRARDRYVIVGESGGYAVLFPATGDLPQLAVQPEARRRGIGTRLLRRAAAVAGKPLRILNIDERDEGIASFLTAAGAARTVRQFEMLRTL
jgi:ribosomal protein S18 acetylase RimI-like enzyme